MSKKKLYHCLGLAIYDKKNERIYIRKDLPKLVKKYLLEHEKRHVFDFRKLKKKKFSAFWFEIRAGFYGFIKQPIGAIMTLFYWLRPNLLWKYSNYQEKLNKIMGRFEK